MSIVVAVGYVLLNALIGNIAIMPNEPNIIMFAVEGLL